MKKEDSMAEKKVEDYFKHLAANQKDLEPEFAKVIDDNFHELLQEPEPQAQSVDKGIDDLLKRFHEFIEHDPKIKGHRILHEVRQVLSECKAKAQSVEADLTPEQQLAFLKGKADMCHGNMEGEDLQGFLRWDKLYNAYLTIAEDMEREMKGLPPVLEPETDQPQEPTAKEMLEALRERCQLHSDHPHRSCDEHNPEESFGEQAYANDALEFAEQWLQKREKE